MPIEGPAKSEEVKELAFLINPISGGGIGKEVYRYLPEILESFGVQRDQWTAELTESNKLSEQTDRMLNQARRVVAVGGDGTIGFVLSRLRHRRRKNVEIGLIPLGTGNDLGRSLGIFSIYDQKGLLACVQRLLKAPAIRFDLWKINGEHTMASYISVGMDAAILHDFDQARKHGHLPQGAFFNKVFYVKAFFLRNRYRISQPATLKWWNKGQEQSQSLTGALCCLVANIDSYASGARPFPEGKINDKCLEILVIRHLRHYLLMVTMSRIWPRGMRFLRHWLPILIADKIELHSPNPEFAQVDGEDMSLALTRDKLWVIEPAGHARMLDLRSTTYNFF